ncbi:MAG: hypothetical protein HY703_00010 [Gemmatimonadetes bacterium]|nr:hypothetical protein [Gemmatimonadota bacterium]
MQLTTPVERGAAAVVPRTHSPAAAPATRRWLTAALELDGWMREREYAGYDPHDLLSSRVVRFFAFRNRWLAVAWTQLGKHCPLQIRPLLGVPRSLNPKAVSLVLAAHLRLARATGEAAFRDSADRLADWLAARSTPGYPGAGWGYPFPWANRDFFVPAGTPSSVVTAFAGHALLDAYERLALPRAFELARDAGNFLRLALKRLPGPEATFCFSYTPLDERAVHNANLLAASLLARLGARLGDGELAAEAMAAARFTVRAQKGDGSFPYGVARRDSWVDSFHTGYALVALYQIGAHLGTHEFEEALEGGIRYWRRAFFRPPAVGCRPGRAFPIDLHAVAHAVLALLQLRPYLPDAMAQAMHLADWSLSVMRDSRGFFYYKKHRLFRNRLVYMRWTQAWMLRALAEMVDLEAPAPGDQVATECPTGPRP